MPLTVITCCILRVNSFFPLLYSASARMWVSSGGGWEVRRVAEDSKPETRGVGWLGVESMYWVWFWLASIVASKVEWSVLT